MTLDVAALREKHREASLLPGWHEPADWPDLPNGGRYQGCGSCGVPWPCDTIAAIDEIERLRDINRKLGVLANRQNQENADLSAQLAAALAEVVRLRAQRIDATGDYSAEAYKYQDERDAAIEERDALRRWFAAKVRAGQMAVYPQRWHEEWLDTELEIFELEANTDADEASATEETK
jgi:hypothetical protein